jgi:hypothetical protein
MITQHGMRANDGPTSMGRCWVQARVNPAHGLSCRPASWHDTVTEISDAGWPARAGRSRPPPARSQAQKPRRPRPNSSPFNCCLQRASTDSSPTHLNGQV